MDVLTLPIDSVHCDPANVRRHPARNIDAIKASLARFGQQRPILVDGSNIVRAGNGTVEAARVLGWSEIRAVRTGDVVLDPYCGSGTTMVACEQLGRGCRGVELDPDFAAVTLERLAGMGLEPKRAD